MYFRLASSQDRKGHSDICSLQGNTKLGWEAAQKLHRYIPENVHLKSDVFPFSTEDPEGG